MNPIPWYVKDAAEIALRIAIEDLDNPASISVNAVVEELFNASDALVAQGQDAGEAACWLYVQLLIYLISAGKGASCHPTRAINPFNPEDRAAGADVAARLRLAGPGPARSGPCWPWPTTSSRPLADHRDRALAPVPGPAAKSCCLPGAVLGTLDRPAGGARSWLPEGKDPG